MRLDTALTLLSSRLCTQRVQKQWTKKLGGGKVRQSCCYKKQFWGVVSPPKSNRMEAGEPLFVEGLPEGECWRAENESGRSDRAYSQEFVGVRWWHGMTPLQTCWNNVMHLLYLGILRVLRDDLGDPNNNQPGPSTSPKKKQAFIGPRCDMMKKVWRASRPPPLLALPDPGPTVRPST